MMVRIFGHGQNPQAASDAPRWYVDEHGDLVFEPGFDKGVIRDLVERRGHALSDTQPQFAFGGAQLVYRLADGSYCAASDHRKDGQAVGY
jgi:gamma-glutamyltranspeptidase/glutathione hydrolase